MNPAQHITSLQRPPTISGTQLMSLMRGLREHAGIQIESPRRVIAHYLQVRMAVLGIVHLKDYLALLRGGLAARAEWMALSDLLTVKETRFFRQAAAMECVAQYVQDMLQRAPNFADFSFWSPGCSTGQEVYSIGMVLEHLLRDQQPGFEWYGLGTDISFQAVEQAKLACYSESEVRSLPQKFKTPYMAEAENGQWQVSENIRSRTDFFQNNLLHVDSPVFSDFNIISCQNVLIYFEREKQHWIIDQLVERLSVDGLLVLGAGEDAQWKNQNMRRVKCPGVCAYIKIGGNI